MPSFFNYFKYTLLYVLLFVMAMTYHPVIMGLSHAAGLESGSILSKYVLLLFSALVGLSAISFLFQKRRASRLFYTYLFFLLLILFMAFIVKEAFSNDTMLEDFKSILIVLAAIFVGRSLRPTHAQLVFLILIFSISVLFAGMMQVILNIGGFQIEDVYLADGKNRLGAMLATASVSFLYLLQDNYNHFSRNKIYHLILLVLFFTGIVIILTIRARAALLTVFLMTFLWIYQRERKHFFSYLLLMIPIVLLVIVILPDSVFDYVNSSITAGSQGDDVSSGRFGMYRDAIRRIINDPFFCDVRNDMSDIGWVHNYPLLKLYSFGLLFSWPLLGVYLYTLLLIVKQALTKKTDYIFITGYSILLVPYVISMLEPTFPFGPGTVTVYNFILLGVADTFQPQINRYSSMDKNIKDQNNEN